jgi:DNA topoisomerase-3
MKEIAKGTKDPDECLMEVAQFIKDDIDIMQTNGVNMRKELGITMNDSSSVERFTGTWNGENVSVKKVYAGHEFTDEEIEQLLNGEEIVIECKGDKGPYKCKGKLDHCEYNGKQYIGFNRTGFVNDNSSSSADRFTGTWNGEEVNVKRVYAGHTFTDDEIKDLLAGKEITIECTGQKGKYKCKGKLDHCEYNGNKYIGFNRTGFVN